MNDTNPDFRCAQCRGNACPIDGISQSEVQVRPDKLVVVASFCYLGDMLSADYSGHYVCENSLEEVQGATTSSHIPPPLLQYQCGHVQLLRADRHYRHAPCQARGCVHSKVKRLLAKLEIEDLDLILRERLCGVF